MHYRWSVRFFCVFSLASLLSLSVPLCARSKSTSSHSTGREYLSALAAANQFLHAWQSQDRETGLLMLSDNAKRGLPENRLQTFLSPGHQAAFEISRGRRLQSGRYAFPAVLFGVRQDSGTIRPHRTELVVVRTGKDDWAIDKLP